MATNLTIPTFQSQQELWTSREDENQSFRPMPHEIAAWASSRSLSQETQNRIRKLLRYAERDLGLLDRKIWQTLRTSTQDISQLLLRRKEDAGNIRVMREAISVPHNIPPEILGRIFVYYLGGTISIPSNSLTDVSPWKLGHVSSYWRNILWSTPEAWKTIRIGSNDDNNAYTTERLLNIRSAIQYIFSSSTTTHAVIVNDHTSTPIADLIGPLNTRITSLFMNNLSSGIFFSFLELPTSSWDHLHTLNIQLFEDDVRRTSVQYSSFQTASKLRDVNVTLKIRSPNMARLFPLVCLFPWMQLTRLTIAQLALPWGTAHHILAQCLAITYCHLTIGRDPDATLTSSTTTLTELKTFQVCQDSSLDWSNFFKPFIFPVLKHMMMIPGTRIHPDNEVTFVHHMFSIDGIVELVLRSGCRLETLSIGGDLRHNARLPVITFDIKSLLQEISPTIRTLVGPFILPSALLNSMQADPLYLGHLEYVVLRLQTRGLRKFLDFLDSHTVYYPEQRAYVYDGSIKQAAIWCHRSTRTTATFKYYQRRSWLYQQVGIDVLISFEDRNVVDEDDEDDEDGNEDGEGGGEGSGGNEEPMGQGGGWLPRYIGQLLTTVYS